MPVRIYEIAKKLGLENKAVLNKAKELGITNAKVPSSSLDKITAEYLEEQLGYKPGSVAAVAVETPAPEGVVPLEAGGGVPPAVPPSEPAPPPPEMPPPSAPPPAVPPAAPPVVIEPPPTSPTPPAPTVVPEPKSDAVVAAPDSVVTEPVTAPEVTPAPVLPPEPLPAPSPVVPLILVPEPVAAGHVPAEEAPPASLTPTMAAAPESQPLAEVKVPANAERHEPVSAAPSPEVRSPVPSSTSSAPAATPPASVPPAAPAAPPAPPAPPVPPPAPPKPRIGEKVGFIQLAPRPRPPERGQTKGPPRPAAPPARGEPPRGRDGRDSTAGGRGPVARPGGGGMQQPRGPGRPAAPQAPTGEEITLRPPIIVRDLADRMGKKPFQVIADLMEQGVFATVNQAIEPEVAQRVCAKHNFRFKVERRAKGEGVHAPVKKEEPRDLEDRPEELKPRPPVVTIMGHVDHGKTTLLDVIRKSNVAAGEAGGITQHIGAYTISVPHPERKGELQQITFLDTPGHAAFSAMRARGANVTDIVVLVVAANDGVMPQTLEALNHAQAAKVPIIVAVNKCDHPNANPMLVRNQLQEKGLIPDEWGGNTFYVDVSALTKQGVDRLLEILCFQADLLELRANPDRLAKGNVIESGLEPGGPTATVLVRHGTLRVGNILLCGEHYGRVRALINEDDKRLKEAGPSVAVKVLGLNGVPEAGVPFNVVETEREAREITAERTLAAQTQDQETRPSRTLEGLLQQLSQESAKVLKLIVKADTQGSVEAIVDALKKVDSDKVSLEVIHHAVGTIKESDVVLASASKGVILGFHTRVDTSAAELAKREGVQIKLYAIIYELVDQVKESMAGLLDPILKEVVFGAAEVRKVFELSKGGKVAGCVVASGRIVRGKARVVRRRSTIYEGLIQTLRRFQDEVNEVRAGMECGIRLEGFDHFEPGDAVECYTIEKLAPKL